VNLFELLEATARRQPQSSAITDLRGGGRLSYGELRDEAVRVADFLRAQGIEAGQRVGLLAGNGVSYIPAAFGVLAAGACLTPVAPGLAAPEVQTLLDGIRVNACLAWPAPRAVREPLGPADAQLAEGACAGYSLHWTARDRTAPEGFAALNPAFVRFTSGTTAERKGVILSHDATWARAEAATRVMAIGPEDRVLWVLPLAYHFAVTITSYVAAGAHVVLCPDALPGAVARALHAESATLVYASPLHFERLASVGSPAGRPRHLRLAISTTTALPAEVARRFEEAWGLPLGQAYGIIEAGLPCINTRAGGMGPGPVGRPAPGYEVVVRGDDGCALGPGEPGDVVVRGPGLFSGYFHPWRPLEAALDNGFFRTDDVGVLDDSGALTLLGRRNSVIVVAGLKLFPEEVEEVLNRHPSVGECRVFGRPHAHLGEVPCAEIVLAEGASLDGEALRSHCARSLTAFKVPVAFRALASLAKTPGGKLLRGANRQA
jgi:acyl-CoA synthetase (AMP-forming)/AMP-acid ligase II